MNQTAIDKSYQNKIAGLKYLRFKVMDCIRGKRLRLKKNPNLKIRGRSIQQLTEIANDYTCQIKAIQKGKL